MQDLAPLKVYLEQFGIIFSARGVLKNRGKLAGWFCKKTKLGGNSGGWYQLTSWNCCPTEIDHFCKNMGRGTWKPTHVRKVKGKFHGNVQTTKLEDDHFVRRGESMWTYLGSGSHGKVTWVLLRWKLGTFAFERYNHISPRIWTCMIFVQKWCNN